MKRLLILTTMISTLLMTGAIAFSQDRDRDDRDEERYHRDSRDQNYWANRLFDRIRADIDHVQAVTPVFSGEQFRLARAKQELNELQSNAAAGRFDNRDLDDVINALQRVLADNRLTERDRNMLTDDLNRMREYRENHDRYYGRRG